MNSFCATLLIAKCTICKYRKEVKMANTIKFDEALPTPMIDGIKKGKFESFGIDNSVSDLLKEVGLDKLLNKLGCHKRSGQSIPVLIMFMIIRPLLKVDSIFMFSRGHYLSVFNTGKDAFYRILQCASIPWRSIH